MRISWRQSPAAKGAALAALATVLVLVYSFYYLDSHVDADIVRVPTGINAEENDESLSSLHQKLEQLQRQEVAHKVAKNMKTFTDPPILQIPWLRYFFEDSQSQVRVASRRVVNTSESQLQRIAEDGPACDALKLYAAAATEVSASCSASKRYGRPSDGGWFVCEAGPYRPKSRACVAMSFGVGGIWEYDDEVAQKLGCRVLAFDPSELKPNHTRPSGVRFFRVGLSSRRGHPQKLNWTVDTFRSLADSLVGEHKVIDILKVDVEGYEWSALEAAAKSGALSRVKQLLVEWHTREATPLPNAYTSKAEYLHFVEILELLHELGFRLWLSKPNSHGYYHSRDCHFNLFPCCLNNYYINTKFLPKTDSKEAQLADALQHSFTRIRLKKVAKPKPKPHMSQAEAESLYYKVMTTDHAECPKWQRVGPQGDSGYELCVAEPFELASGCLVYSFGVGDQTGFEDEMAKRLSCEVRMFDPSTGDGDHKRGPKEWFIAVGLGSSDAVNGKGWEVRKFSTLLRRFKHESFTIDVLKIDIEFDEWDALRAAIKDSSLRRVKQLVLETHVKDLTGQETSGSEYLEFISIWYDLYGIGFRQWRNRENRRIHFLGRSGSDRPCCHVHSLVNIRFLSGSPA